MFPKYVNFTADSLPVAKAEEPAKAADAKEPVVKAPVRSSESELDIMVEE